MTAEPSRHRDRGEWLVRYADRMYVVCPRCGGRAVVVPRPGLPAPAYAGELLFQPRRMACPGCGGTADWEPEVRGRGLIGATMGGTTDPFFGRPLWLQARCVGHILWAYNEDHIDALAGYVGAHLRERDGVRPTRAMFPRLPRWMKAAGNRSAVLAGLATLRTLAARAAPVDRPDAAHDRGDRPRRHDSIYFRGGPWP